MDKKPSFLWALAIGAAMPVLQLLLFALRFNSINSDSSPMDYVAFFAGGLLIGLALIYFLRRAETKGAYRATIIGFAIGLPFSLLGMMLGGLIGPLGSIFLGISPGIFATLVGYYLGRSFSKGN